MSKIEQELIQKIKDSKGPDRSIDFAVEDFFGTCPLWGFEEEGNHLRVCEYWYVEPDSTMTMVDRNGIIHKWRPEFLTESIDASLEYLEEIYPGTTRAVDATFPKAGISVTIFLRDVRKSFIGEHRLETHALLLAMLEASNYIEESLK